MMLRRGADPVAIDFDGCTALDWALLVNRVASSSPDTPDVPDMDSCTSMVAMLAEVTPTSWRTLHTVDTLETDLLALHSFPVQDLVDIPPTKLNIKSEAAIIPSAVGSDEAMPSAVSVPPGPPPPPLCDQCQSAPSSIRCLHCEQYQCERCCVSLHKQDGRRHHKVHCACRGIPSRLYACVLCHRSNRCARYS